MRKLSIALALVAMLVVTSAQARDQIKIVGSSTVVSRTQLSLLKDLVLLENLKLQ